MSRHRNHNKHRGAISEMIACSYLLEQGYEVFRNVSAHGAIDLIAIKNSEVHYFDVKTAAVRGDGSALSPKLTTEQHRIGVKPLMVLPDGSVKEGIPPSRCAEELLCPTCQKMFLRRKALQQFCSVQCRRDRASGMRQSALTYS